MYFCTDLGSVVLSGCAQADVTCDKRETLNTTLHPRGTPLKIFTGHLLDIRLYSAVLLTVLILLP